MALKKKDTNSSSESSSSNSSSSSSTSSSTSGSESSSSDSENTSTSGGKSANPSSDSDKKTQQKKKNSTTVTPKAKTDSVDGDKSKEKQKKPQPPKSTVYSSDTDDSSPKPNAKRKPQPKPKSSATVTPVPKNPKTSLKNVPKKLNPPRKVAQKNVTPKDAVKTSSNNKLDDSKKSKTKSIFSPDNSSDSDDQNSTPPPPKLTAMKTAATKVHNRLKSKPKPLIPIKPRTSSVSSNSSESSRSSRSSSDSNHDSGRSKQGSAKKKTPSKRDKKSPPPPQLVSDADSVTTRKQTRSLSNRKSKHVISRMPSESDSDTGSKTSITKSPVKRPPKESFMQRKIKSDGEEERKCPMEGCDSTGHLGGKILRHFTLEACPLYHNLTPHHCKEAYMERLKKDEERKKNIAIIKASAGRSGSPTPEQKLFRDKVKELRGKAGNNEIKMEDEGEGGKDRQPPLSKYSNKYDIRLFQEAQAVASEAIEDELKLLANVRYTKLIEMGKFEMEVWYQSPYPEDFARLPKLYICEYCLRYMKARKSMERHAAKCVWRHPPGEEVYRKEKISVWEVDGKRYKSYCQNLCLLAKFFLDHKTLYYDVEPFLFYVMTIGDSEGCHTVGYFSKEKNSFLNYNVSCILTLPPYQRQGYGRLLIDFSYLLTRVEGKIGSPEKPLSDLGLISYRSYWKDVLLEYLCNLEGKQISIKDISQEMAINSYDIVSTLQALGMMKYWKGKHIILKKQDVIEEYIERSKRRGVTYKEIDPNCLKWTPFVPPSTPNSNA